MKINLFGNFGSTNLGNEATLLVIISRLRLLFPGCELCCVCGFPETVIKTHGIDAVPYAARSVRIWNRQASLRERLRLALRGVREEAGDYARAWRVLEGADLMIVPGTGLLTDAWGLSRWGPYGLLKWSLVARLRKCRVIFLSVGAGPVHGRLGRLLLRSALSLADYRSFRDGPSRKVAASLGLCTRDDRIYPDLVFDLSPPSTPTAVEREGGRAVVGLGLMEYQAKYSVPSPTGDTYYRYLDSLAVFVGWLLDCEYDVKLLLGDADTLVIDELRATLRRRLGRYAEERVTDSPIDSINELLSQLSSTDFVVATRFHNVLMSLLLGKPSIAISFHHKLASLMSEMGLSEFCHDMNQIDADTLIAQFQELVRRAEDLKIAIADRVGESRLALDEQYELLFGGSSEEPALDGAIAAS